MFQPLLGQLRSYWGIYPEAAQAIIRNAQEDRARDQGNPRRRQQGARTPRNSGT